MTSRRALRSHIEHGSQVSLTPPPTGEYDVPATHASHVVSRGTAASHCAVVMLPVGHTVHGEHEPPSTNVSSAHVAHLVSDVLVQAAAGNLL